MKEAVLQRHVLAFLKKLPNTWAEKISQRSTRGTPDILACINGHFVGLELKGDDGRLLRLQEEKLEAILAAGGLAAVVTPTNWADIKSTLSFLSTAAKERPR